MHRVISMSVFVVVVLIIVVIYLRILFAFGVPRKVAARDEENRYEC